MRVQTGRLLIFILLCLCMVLLDCGGPRTYITVIDTSGSMGGKRQLIARVKKSFVQLVNDSVRDGDRLVLMSFDEKLIQRGDYQIKKDEDKISLIDSIKTFSAKKRNTDMWKMVLSLRKESIKLEKDGNDQIIIIFSDGEDAPGPYHRRKKMISLDTIKDREASMPIKEKYIYYVNFSSGGSQKAIKELAQTLQADMKTIDAGGETDANSAAKKDEAAMNTIIQDIGLNRVFEFFGEYWMHFTGVLATALLIFLLFLLFKSYQDRHRPEGYILYYEGGVNSPNKLSYRLEKLKSPKLSLGSRYGVNMRIKQLGLPQDFNFRYKKENNESILKPTGRTAELIEYIKQKTAGTISFGDKFKIGNYIFEYSSKRDDL